MGLFDNFMMFYFGFFGVTCLLYPSVHAQDGPFPNPMAYWTTIAPATDFTFRIAGIVMTTLAIGPKFLGVGEEAFVNQMLFVNILFMFLFIYFSFYAPLETAVDWVWEMQAYLASALAGWCVIEKYNGMDAPKLVSGFARFLALFFSFFGVSLVAAPELLFGPPSPFAYWNEWGEAALLTGRSLGCSLLALVGVGYLFMETDAFIRQAALFNVANLALFVLPAYNSAGAAVAWIWKAQVAMQVPITLVNLFLISGAVSSVKAYSVSLSMPKSCGLNAETFVFVNIFWFLPFLAGFLIDPNAMFGPSGMMPSGLAMFTSEMNETAIWFGRAWATACFTTVMGAALFSHPHSKVCKQLFVFYVTSTALFVGAVTTGTFFNPTVMLPMTALNVVFLVVCGIILKKDSDETGKGILDIV